ncbi:MAG: fatty acid desaturase [Deltaproteobacteria bacterium]|nr:MAG: fatty acid desaturase [Deltaproteobacteria bacterium]
MRAPRPWLSRAERLAERVFRVEHGANMGPLLHVACYVGFFALLIVPGAVVAWPARAALWTLTTLLNYSLTIGVMHMHCHRKLFVARAPNRVLEVLLCFPSLLTSAEMTVLHVHHHHKHNDGPEDVTSTLGCERGPAAVGYWLRYGAVVKWFTLRSIYVTDVKRWRKQRFRTTFAIDTALCLGALAALTWWQPRTMATCYWIPFAATHATIGYFSWLTHAPAGDRTGPDGSINTVNNMLNLFIFNQGYHAVHHEHPGIHWTDIPDKLAAMTQLAPAYIVPYWVTPNSAWRILAPARSRDARHGARWQARLEARIAADRVRNRWLPYFAWI